MAAARLTATSRDRGSQHGEQGSRVMPLPVTLVTSNYIRGLSQATTCTSSNSIHLSLASPTPSILVELKAKMVDLGMLSRDIESYSTWRAEMLFPPGGKRAATLQVE